MNRQIRRVEEKKERKAEEKKAKAKAERQKRKRERSEQRKRASSEKKPAQEGSGGDAKAPTARPGPRKSNPGRFSGALTAATVFFIALQAVAPTDGTVPSQIVSASFYLLFGYFSVLWMMRRGSPRAIQVAVIAAALMGVVTFLSQWLQPALQPAPIMLALILPLAVAGAYLGRLVWNRAP
jgi:Flp pilus assembly protein TadB